jgi:hypothetical protein
MTKPGYFFLIAGLLCAGCSKKTDTQSAKATNTGSGNPLTAPVDYLGAVSKAQQTAIKVTDVASLTKAIQDFQLAEERNPSTLTELVQKGYLARLPATPYGMKYQYNPTNAQVKVVKQ